MASRRHHFLLEIAYRGSSFHGLQRQPGLRTVASELEHHLREALTAPVRGLAFTARTDAGVHAAQNFASFWLREEELSEDLKARLAGPSGPLSKPGPLLPLALLGPANGGDLQLLSFRAVPRHVHARNSCRGKRYGYTILDGANDGTVCAPDGTWDFSALDINQAGGAWPIAAKADVLAMREAAEALVGQHDFSSFRASGCGASTPVRRLTELSIERLAGGELYLRLEGESFLRKMVRIITGTLVEIGIGVRPTTRVSGLLGACNRAQAGVTAPARGLCLEEVYLDL